VRIERIHWSIVPEQLAPPGIDGVCAAVWPAPLDQDACFSAAGFAEFADSDAQWELDFERFVARLYSLCGRAGNAVPIGGEHTVSKGRWPWRRTRVLSVEEALLFAASDDSSLPCTIRFGSPARAQLTTSDGHRVVFVQPGTAFDLGQLVREIAAGLPIVQTDLDWSLLAPEKWRLGRSSR